MQPALRLLQDGQSLKINPAVAAAGPNDTRLFRLLDQDEGCLAREATPLPLACQLFLRATRFRLTRLWKGLRLMKTRSLLANLTLCGALAIAVPLYAKPMTATLPLSHSAKVGQTDLKAGEYRFKIDGDHLTILRGGTAVAESTGRWEDRDAKSPYTSVVTNADGQVIELRFEGKKSVFVLGQ